MSHLQKNAIDLILLEIIIPSIVFHTRKFSASWVKQPSFREGMV